MNNLYPNSIFDNNLKQCASCSPKKPEKNHMPHAFEARAFYPHSIASQNQEQHANHHNHHNHYNNQNNHHNHNTYQASSYVPQNYNHEPKPPYDYNAYVQANQGWQNEGWQNQAPQYNAQFQSTPPVQNQPPRQRNMFGSLDPSQLLSMITNKSSFAGILGGLGNSNPQLSMLMGLMQNTPKARRKQQEKKPEEIIVDENEKKTTSYKTVKDFYKENEE